MTAEPSILFVFIGMFALDFLWVCIFEVLQRDT